MDKKFVRLIYLLNNLPEVLKDIIMNFYWETVYKENVIEQMNFYIKEIKDIYHFSMKHIVQDPDRIHSNFHLHYHYFRHNDTLERIKKDKGINLFLKSRFKNVKYIGEYNSSIPTIYDVSDSNPYTKINPKIKNLAIFCISNSNWSRYLIYHQFKKF